MATPFWPGKSYEQRSLAGSSPWGNKTVRHDLETKHQPKGNTGLIQLLEKVSMT